MTGAVKGLLVVAAVLLGAQVAEAETGTPCPVGASRKVDTYDRLQTKPFVMACADLQHQGRTEVIAYRSDEPYELGRSDLCVEMRASTATTINTTATCRPPTEPLQGLKSFDELFSLRKRWAIVQGFASLQVASVSLRYRSRGVLRRPRGIVTPITDPALLQRLKLAAPFAHFVVEASVHARSIRLLAHDAGGKLISKRSLGRPWPQ